MTLPTPAKVVESDVVHFTAIRELQKGVKPEPIRSEGSDDWLLPFTPRDGRARTIQPQSSAWLATGLALHLPPETYARILHPMRPGLPGLCVVSMEVDARNNGMEILVRARNESDHEPLIFYPGKHYFVLRLSRSDDFVLRSR